MNAHDLIALVDRLRALPTETEWLEFKRNNADPQEVGEYLSIGGGQLADGEVAGGPARIDDCGHLRSSAGSKLTSFNFPVRTS